MSESSSWKFGIVAFGSTPLGSVSQRFSQTPRSRLRRLVSNIEVLREEADEILVTANAMVCESQMRGDFTWASRNEYLLRRDADGLRMARKTVVLVNNSSAMYSMAFLI